MGASMKREQVPESARESHGRPILLVLSSTYPRWRDDYEPGFVHKLNKQLARRFNVIVITPDAPGAEPSGELDGIEVVRYRYAPRNLQTLVSDGGIIANIRRARWKLLLLPTFFLAQYLAVRRVLSQRRVAVIHAHWLIPQGVSALFAAGRRLPYVITSHGADVYGLKAQPWRWLKQRVAAKSAAMTAVSNAMKRECQRQGLQPPHISVLPMGVDLQTLFTPSSEPRQADRILFVGRLVAKKGLDYLIEALPTVLRQRPAVQLIVVGFGPDEAKLKSRTRELALTEHVHFVGACQQHELPSFYQQASLTVLPFITENSGDQEGLPVVIMEAIGCECPVIAGSVMGIEDIFSRRERHAFTVHPPDTESLADRILAVLNDQCASVRSIAEVRQRLLQRLDWATIAESYIDVLDLARLQQVHRAP